MTILAHGGTLNSSNKKRQLSTEMHLFIAKSDQVLVKFLSKYGIVCARYFYKRYGSKTAD